MDSKNPSDGSAYSQGSYKISVGEKVVRPNYGRGVVMLLL